MSELTAALRRLVDQIERGDCKPGMTQAVLVLADDNGNAQATYLGRRVPAATAGTLVLCAGIASFVSSGPLAVAPQAQPAPVCDETGSIFNRGAH